MMVQVAQIILDEELQFGIAGRRFPDVPGGVCIRMANDVDQVPVVGQP
jgi:hypothetical protein